MTIRYEHAIEVNCSPSQAFAFLDDLPRTPQWLGPCTKLEKVSPGPNQVGDQLRYEYSQSGQSGTMQGEIVERVTDQKLVCRYFDNMMEVVVDFSILPAGQHTRLEHVITMTPQSFMMKMMSPLIRRAVPKQTSDAMNAIKQMIESQAS